jgi:hypothetical protein
VADPDEVARILALTEIAKAEANLFQVIWAKFQEWATKLRRAVFGRTSSDVVGQSRTAPDPLGVLSTSTWWGDQVDDLLPVVEEIWTDGYAGLPEAPEAIPNGQWGVRQATAGARNRLKGVPDSVFSHVRAATMKATTEGWSAPDLALKVEEILGEHGQESWRGRAMTIARTEALSAYNGGKFASFVAFADSTGGQWEKVWLATHDHRTRFTHTGRGGGDLQRVPLLDRFVIGGAPLLYPGDPEGPAGEIINCRCSMLLVEPGEHTDLSDRHHRSAP